MTEIRIGRPPIDGGQTRRVNLRLDDHTVALLAALGEGSISDGVRTAARRPIPRVDAIGFLHTLRRMPHVVSADYARGVAAAFRACNLATESEIADFLLAWNPDSQP